MAQPKKSKTLALIVASAVILLCAGVVVVFTKTGHQEVEPAGTASQQSVNVSSQLPPEQPVSDYPLVGLSITSIDDGSPAMMAGLQVGDIVVQYGETKVLDTASFFAAQEAYAKNPSSNILLGVVRNGRRINSSVPSGRIGFFSEENNSVMLQFYALMNNIAVQEQLPPEQFEQAKRDGREIESRQSMVKKAEQLLDQAQREGTITDAQLLTARVYLIPEEASPKEESLRQELLKKLMANQAERYILSLAQDRFFNDKKYRAAIVCLNRSLENDPSDVSTRLNLGVAYNGVSMFKEADATADYVLNNRQPLSRFGYGVLYQIKALAALGKGDYQNSTMYAGKSFDINPTDYAMSLWQLAAAHTGDIQQFYEANNRSRAVIPGDYARLQTQVDAVEAYALAKSNQRDRAKELTGKWKEVRHYSGKVSRYWKKFPGGSDVVKNWQELVGTSD